MSVKTFLPKMLHTVSVINIFLLPYQVYLGALKYVPHAVYKLLENMPMPWEQVITNYNYFT